MTALRLGTRGSALALAQARSVAALLDQPCELVEITTAGDIDRASGDKSRWVGALEAALLAGEIDLAVHSAKDVPGELAAGTVIAATPARANPWDVIVGSGRRIGMAFWRRRRPRNGGSGTSGGQLFLQEADDLAGLGEAPLLLLGEDDLVARGDLEHPASALHQVRPDAELLLDLVRQTGGARVVVSDGAVLDDDVPGHARLLSPRSL